MPEPITLNILGGEYYWERGQPKKKITVERSLPLALFFHCLRRWEDEQFGLLLSFWQYFLGMSL